MCRFVGYIGTPLLLADLISRPENSLVRQSYDAKERSNPLNGDGFGVGWYTPEMTPEPGVYRSITPAWNDQNLLDLVGHTSSPCFFAHVRAASPDSDVSRANCHPFRFGRFLWMHNGTIEGFSSIKRVLTESLPEDLYLSIGGTTDSEHAFAVFLDMLGSREANITAAALGETMVKTIWKFEKWGRDAAISRPSIYNFAVTDGQNVATVRYVSDPSIEPISLYISKQGEYACRDGKPEIIDCCSGRTSVIIASECLTDKRDDWERVAPNHVVTIDSQLEVGVHLIPNA